MTKSKVNTNGKIRLAAIIAGLILLLSACVAIGFVPESRAEEADFPLSVSIKSGYALGESFAITDATLSDGQAEYSALGVLIAPSGKAYSKTTVILSESGRYTLRYTATAPSGKRLMAEKTFTVSDKLFSAGRNTTIGYATGLGKYGNREGLKVDLASGETFRYAKSVNIANFKKSDNVLSLIVLPENLGTREIDRLYVDFIDAYDSANVVRLALKANVKDVDWPTTYCSAGATGQSSVGLEDRAPYNIKVDGKEYRLHVDNDYGACPIHSFTGKTADGYNIDNREIALNISWDYAEKQLYATTTEDKSTGGLVTDLDNTALYDSPWSGFTTGEAFIEVTGSAYSGSTATILFTDIAGEDLTLTDYIDRDKPVLSVDLRGYETAPAAQVGKAYPVFAASAFDVHDGKNLDVETSAYYNYGTSAYAEIGISDGFVIPDRTGEITFIYTASDAAGNEIKETVRVTVCEAVTLAATINDDATAGKAGSAMKVSSLNVTGAYPDYEISAVAVLVSDEKVCYVIDTKTFEFTPLYAGEYRIEYTVSDFLETVKVLGSIEAEANEESLILGDVILPRYFIKNATYVLPALSATSFTGGKPNSVDTKVYVSEDGGERTLTGEEYTVYANDTVTVAYVSPTGDEKTYTVPVKNVGYGGSLDLAKYFDLTGLTASATSDGIVFKPSGEDKHSATFINAVLADPTRVEFSVPENGANFTKLNVTLTDSENPNEMFTLTYEKAANGVRTYVNGGIVSVSEKTFENESVFSLYYDNENVALYADRTSDYTTRVILPDSFKGFGSQKVYISFSIEETTSHAAIKIGKINNQLLDTATVDETEPQSTVRNSRGRNDVGTVVKLSEVIFCDVLDPHVKATLKVTAPDGGSVTDLGGVTLDGGDGAAQSPCVMHEIRLDSYGRYSVSYTATDGSDNNYRYSYSITVADITPPVITLGEADKLAKVGDTVKIASATVTDDRSENLTVSVYLTLPDGRVMRLDGTAFVANQKGRFIVTYYATDEEGNVALESYAVTVE